MTTLDKVRKAIEDVSDVRLGSVSHKGVIEKSTVLGRDDLGEWAPDSEVIIYTEHGLPSGDSISFWEAVTDKLYHDGFFCEPVNSAVIAVWPIDD